MVPRPHAPPLQPLGRGAQRRLADQPPALLRRADPAVVPVGDDGEADYDHPIVPGEDTLPIDPSTDVPPGYTADAARPAGRLHRRPRRDGHVGDVVADAADRRRLGRRSRPLRPRVPDGPAPAGPGDHPHLAVRHGRPLALRARLAAVGERRRSTAGSSTPTARRCRSRSATWSRRWVCSSSTAPTPCATGRCRPAPASTPPSARSR